MPPLLSFFLRRILSIPISLLIITAILYSFMMMTPAEERASLYFPANMAHMTEEQMVRYTELIIERHHLRAPFPVQYGEWLIHLVSGDWGWSPTLQGDVLAYLLRRTSVTIELTLYTLLFFIPLGVLSGVLSALHRGQRFDRIFRGTSFTATSLPPFVAALLLMAFFYVSLHWFPPERLGIQSSLMVGTDQFIPYTGLMTLDGLLNGRPEISLDALRHLVLPVVSLSLFYWATLGRVARVTMLEELNKEYVIAARARGIPERRVIWRHVFRNVLAPSLTSSALMAASLFTGAFVIERVFNLKGISEMAMSLISVPDAPACLGFAIYSVIIVLVIMLVLDTAQAMLDPRLRQGLLST